MKREHKGIFFDLDGVIINSDPLWDYIITTIISKYSLNTEFLKQNDGYNFSTEDAIKMILKHSNRYTLTLYTEIIECVDSLYADNYESKTSLITGVIDVLEWLHLNGFILALVSNSSKAQVERIVKHYNLNRYFQDKIIASDDVKLGKPDKEPYIKAINKTGLQKEDVLVIEDSLTGITSAKNAGLSYVRVNNGMLYFNTDTDKNTLLEHIQKLLVVTVC